MDKVIIAYMKITLLFFIALVHFKTDAQIHKVRAKKIAVEDHQNTKDSIHWQTCNILIVLNETDEKINIYSQKEQQFDGIQKLDSVVKRGTTTYRMMAIDNAGVKCLVQYTLFHETKTEDVISIIYQDKTYYYKISEIDF
jgi:hypothetical protein